MFTLLQNWTHVLLEDGIPLGVARDVEYREDWGNFGLVYFFSHAEPPVYDWLGRFKTMELLPVEAADVSIIAEVSAELRAAPLAA